MKNCHLHLNLLFHVMTQLECNAHSNSGNHTVSWCVILVSSVLNYCRSVRYHHHGMEVSNSKSPNPILVNAQQADSPAPDCPKRRFHAPQTKQLAGRGVSCGRTWSCLGSLALIWLKDLISRSCNPHSNAPLPSQLKGSKFLALFLACWKLKSWDTYEATWRKMSKATWKILTQVLVASQGEHVDCFSLFDNSGGEIMMGPTSTGALTGVWGWLALASARGKVVETGGSSGGLGASGCAGRLHEYWCFKVA